MATDNTKLGYCYSVALHLVIAFGLCAYAFINALFPKEEKENKIVFDMVEPSPEQIADLPPPPAPDASAPEIKTEKIEKIDPVEIPEPTPPEPEPEPQPEPTQPEPAPAPTPVPTPKSHTAHLFASGFVNHIKSIRDSIQRFFWNTDAMVTDFQNMIVCTKGNNLSGSGCLSCIFYEVYQS